MTEKVKIGEHEYVPPFVVDCFDGSRCDDQTMYLIKDKNSDCMSFADIESALNELAQLRQENGDLKKRVEELENFDPNIHVSMPPKESKTYRLVEITPDEEGKA